jgi:quinol monooxygenase YgiN
MSGPIVFISHFRVKPGRFDGFSRLSREVATSIEAEKPATAAYLIYLDESRERATFVHLFADERSMDRHFEGADERAIAAFELIEPDGWEIHGAPSAKALETIRQAAAQSGVALALRPVLVGGFLRR